MKNEATLFPIERKRARRPELALSREAFEELHKLRAALREIGCPAADGRIIVNACLLHCRRLRRAMGDQATLKVLARYMDARARGVDDPTRYTIKCLTHDWTAPDRCLDAAKQLLERRMPVLPAVVLPANVCRMPREPRRPCVRERLRRLGITDAS